MRFMQHILCRSHFIKITNLPMLHMRTEGGASFSPTLKQEEKMDRIYRALGIAAALGTSGLMFALTLA